MATITQTIPNYALGISEQPDEQKLPGQVRDAVNVVPDIADGLSKRPGTQFITTLQNTNSTGSWFTFQDKELSPWVGNVDLGTGELRCWRCSDGAQASIIGTENSYLTHANKADIQSVTVEDKTFLVNRNKVVQLNAITADSSQKDGSGYHAVYVELKTVTPRRSYALNIFNDSAPYETEFTASTVELLPLGFSQVDESCPHTGSRVHLQTDLGIVVRVTATGVPYVSGYQTNPATNAIYGCQYTGRVDLLHGGSYPHSHLNSTFQLYLQGTGSGAAAQLVTVRITAETQGYYRKNLGSVRPVPTDLEAETGVSVTGILNSLVGEINAIPNINCRVIGNGLWISSANAFQVEALEKDLFNIVTDEVNDVSLLPTSCRHGYIVKVTNSGQLTEDDHYLKFHGEDGLDGVGVWTECAKPGVKTSFDTTTMPVVLTHIAGAVFNLGPYLNAEGSSAWTIRDVGDEDTNETPSFVGKKIEKLLLHRDRLVALSGTNVIMSSPDNIGNFWNRTALTFSGTDKIDIRASADNPAPLKDGIETNAGLVIFSSNAQYLLTTDSDILNPETAKIYTLSTFNYNPNIAPISLGTSLAFLDNAGRNSKLFEMLNIRRETEPEVLDQSKVVSRLLAKNLDIITNSRENAYILMGKVNTKEIYGFRYYNVSGKRLQGAWFKWTFARDIYHFFIQGDELYIIFSDQSFVRLNLVDVDETPEGSSYGDKFNIHLDHYQTVSAASLSYSSSTDTTTFTLPSIYNQNVDVAAIVIGNNDNRGRYQLVSSGSNLGGSTVTLTGDWSSNAILVGEQFEMKVELPTIFVTSEKSNRVVTDTTSSLVVQRIKLNFGDVGQITTKLERLGKDDYVDTHESSILDRYQANRLPFIEGRTQTIPVYERNHNVNVTLTSTHPSPATLQSMSWEGDYNNRFYKRI
jgi:hypothetical protein